MWLQSIERVPKMTDSELHAIFRIYDQGFAEEYEQKLGHLSMFRNNVQHLESELFAQLHEKLRAARENLQQRENELYTKLHELTKMVEQLVDTIECLYGTNEQFTAPNLYRIIYGIHRRLSEMLEAEKEKSFRRVHHK